MSSSDPRPWLVRDAFLVAALPEGLSDGAWQDLCDRIASPEIRTVLLAIPETIELDDTRRRQLSVAVRREPRVNLAVVSEAPVVRALGKLAGWLGLAEVEVFAWAELAEAYAHLAPPGIEEDEALAMVDAVLSGP